MSANRNITRIQRLTTGGYLVRVTRKGKMHSDYFSDVDYGGKRKALLAAREFRDQLESKLKGYTSKQIAKKERANNTSGVVGVRYVEELDPRWESQPVYGYWVAQWSPSKGVRKTARFSVEKYGDDEALRLAIKARNKGVASMES
ncbi:AP2 domain protein [Rubripirellula lacrimiformis]|uniref:AP2 domain protein n=1 Tax=Rubripirellula lacrimiformis TaxID=1930273 RepID=A0A517N6U4_9BACT|nr:AP2/ERF family transcription factor [Rubripirellula lacrimiformis]QDT02857.1 AP2 domain protein [Rubripirellula lacrimiformis]